MLVQLVEDIYYLAPQDKHRFFEKQYRELKSQLTFYQALDFSDDEIIDRAFKSNILQELCSFAQIVSGPSDKDIKVLDHLRESKVEELAKSDFFQKVEESVETFIQLKAK